jgi:GNAT superfamily N-acetyltransferase
MSGAPPRKLRSVVTHLEMLEPQAYSQAPRAGVIVLHARTPTISYYRYLYDTVGERWLWWERRKMSDRELASIVQDPRVEVHVLFFEGVPAGYAELDRRRGNDIEVAYFGLIPDFIGKGLGRAFLCWAVTKAWSHGPDRVWVHTCDLDHPSALPLYKKVGFVPFKEEIEIVDDPRDAGLL